MAVGTQAHMAATQSQMMGTQALQNQVTPKPAPLAKTVSRFRTHSKGSIHLSPAKFLLTILIFQRVRHTPLYKRITWPQTFIMKQGITLMCTFRHTMMDMDIIFIMETIATMNTP